MPKYIVKLTDPKDGRDYYLEWSTVVDAPVTYGMSREEFESHYRTRYGEVSMEREYGERMARVDAKGVSSGLHESAQDLIGGLNRAGPDETMLDVDGVIEVYCRNRPS